MHSSKKLKSDQQNNENTEDESPGPSRQTEESNKQEDDSTKDEDPGSSRQTSTSCTERKRKINESSADVEQNLKRSKIESVASVDDTWVCENCKKKISSQISQSEHVCKQNESTRPYLCHICGALFTMNGHLNDHIKHLHPTVDYECNFCERKFSTLTRLKTHLLRHIKERLHPCDTCDKKFTTEIYLRRHMQEMHIDDKYMCPVCYKKFRKNYLDQHIAIHYSERKHSCDMCEKSFKQRQSLNRHKKEQHSKKEPYLRENFELDIKIKNYGSSEILPGSDRVKYNPGPYPARIYGKDPESIGLLSDLIREVRRKKYNEDFRCTKCIDYFSRKESLRRHMRNIHSEKKPHTCQKCGKGFRLKTELNNHNKYDKSCKDSQAESQYKCDKCGKQFSTKNEYDSHHCKQENPSSLIQQRGENSERETDFKSQKDDESRQDQSSEIFSEIFEEDQKNFNAEYNEVIQSQQYLRDDFTDVEFKHDEQQILLESLKMIKVRDTENPSTNQQGGESSELDAQPSTSGAQLHNMSVDAHRCHRCAANFSHKQDLQEHIQLHTDGEKYKCDECDMLFGRKKDLTRHKSREHSKKNVYKCKKCGKSFQLEEDFERHGERCEYSQESKDEDQCELCKKTFGCERDLLEHMDEEHINERGLKKHKCQEENISKEKPFICWCGKKFKYEANLEVHMRNFEHQPDVSDESDSN